MGKHYKTSCRIYVDILFLKVQCPFQERNPNVGSEPVQYFRHHRKLGDRAESMGVPGGCFRRRRHRKAAASGTLEELHLSIPSLRK